MTKRIIKLGRLSTERFEDYRKEHEKWRRNMKEKFNEPVESASDETLLLMALDEAIQGLRKLNESNAFKKFNQNDGFVTVPELDADKSDETKELEWTCQG